MSPYIWTPFLNAPLMTSPVCTLPETHHQIVPPEFLKTLKSCEVVEGNPFSFECHVQGIPSPTVSWFKDELNIDNSPDYVFTKINGMCCLKIRQVAQHHTARYTCRALNAGGESASSARLSVICKQNVSNFGMKKTKITLLEFGMNWKVN